jgi:hypothetical protein
LVATAREKPVAGFRTVTCAPAIGSASGVVTRPAMAPDTTPCA